MGIKLSLIDYYKIFNQERLSNKNLHFIMHEIILTEEEYRKAIMRFLEICDAEPGTPEFKEALLLTKMMEDYENLSCYERRNLN